MKNHTPQDEIDRELSRIFFREKVSAPLAKKHATKNTVSNNVDNKKKKMSRPLILLITSTSIILIIGSLYFFTGNNNAEKVSVPATKTAIGINSIDKTSPLRTFLLSKDKMSTMRKSSSDNFKKIHTLYSFEKDIQEWEIPLWAEEKRDHVAVSLKHMKDFASKGSNSLELTVNFPGKTWHGALVEVQHYIGFESFNIIAADIYIPKDAPQLIRGKIILTIGETWDFTEMIRGTRLTPGAWTTVFADISEKSNDWKKTVMSERIKSDVRKIAIRIESDKTAYFGPVYIDNIRLGVLGEEKVSFEKSSKKSKSSFLR